MVLRSLWNRMPTLWRPWMTHHGSIVRVSKPNIVIWRSIGRRSWYADCWKLLPNQDQWTLLDIFTKLLRIMLLNYWFIIICTLHTKSSTKEWINEMIIEQSINYCKHRWIWTLKIVLEKIIVLFIRLSINLMQSGSVLDTKDFHIIILSKLSLIFSWKYPPPLAIIFIIIEQNSPLPGGKLSLIC